MKRVGVFGVVLLALAWAAGAPGVAAQSDSAQQNSADLSQQVQDLKKELEEVKAQLASMKASTPAPAVTATGSQAAAVPQNAVVSTPASDSAAKNNGPSLASLLGSTTLSGFVDTYYGQNFNNPANRTTTYQPFNADTNQFGLNLIELVVDKQPDASNSRTGYHIALGFGQAMNAVNAGETGFDQYLEQAYFSYLAPVGKGLQFDVGKFVTPAGAEVIETKDDWNYSRGLLFSYAIPYFHFGLRAKYTFNSKYSITGLVTNGWNNTIADNSGKTAGVSFGWTPTKKWGVTETYLAGPQQFNNSSNWRQLSDTVITYNPTSRLSLMVNGDYGRGDRIIAYPNPVYWTGVAGYVRYALNDRYALATRYEYYDDPQGFTTLTAQHLQEFTETFERLIAHHIITRLEYRRDFSNQPVFTKGITPVLAQQTVTAGLVYTFDSRESK
jgi:hypothetical protein